MTDYGSSTARIIFSFLCLSILFGMIYFSFGIVPCLHSIVHDLHPEGVGMSIGHILARAMYFSIVTMTTLGFGDMHATKTGDIWGLLGYLVLSVQVILGYILLGALITRLGILFYADGPALDPKVSTDSEDFKKLSGEDILKVKIIEEPLESTKKNYKLTIERRNINGKTL